MLSSLYRRRLDIGLFGLVGMVGVSMAPVIGRVVDGLVPWCATVIATFGSLIFYSIQTGAGGINIGAVIVACFGIDVFRQTQQVSLTHAVFGLDANARSRLNAVLIISVRRDAVHCPLTFSYSFLAVQIFIGQIMGTAVGTSVFNNHGWRPAAALSVGWQGFCMLILFMRGPHVPRYTWFGYKGGFEIRKRKMSAPPSPVEEPAEPSDNEEKEERRGSVVEEKKRASPADTADAPELRRSIEKGGVEEADRTSLTPKVEQMV